MTITKWRAIPTVPPIEPGTYNMLDALSENLRKAQTAINAIQSTSYSGLFGVTAGTGLTATTTGGVANVALGVELAGLASLSTTGFVQRTGPGLYSTSAALGFAPGRAQSGKPVDVQPYGFIHEDLDTGDLYTSKLITGFTPSAPSVVHFSAANTGFVSTPTNHYELNFPFTPTAGNLVVIGTLNNNLTTAPAGWTVVYQANGTFNVATWYAKIWQVGDPISNIYWPDGASVQLYIWEIAGSGSTVAACFDQGMIAGTTGGSISGFSNLTTVVNELALAVGTTASSFDPPVSFDSTWTQDSVGTGQNTAGHKSLGNSGIPVTLIQISNGYTTNRNISAILIKPGNNLPTGQGWAFIGPKSVSANGIKLDRQVRSMNFTGAPVTGSSDNNGNISIAIGPINIPVITGNGDPSSLSPIGTIYIDSASGNTWTSTYNPVTLPNIVQAVSQTVNTSPLYTMTSNPVNGNLLIAIHGSFVLGPPLTPAAGWTRVNFGYLDSATNMDCAIYYKYAGSGEPLGQTPVSSGATLQFGTLWEISNIANTWASAFESATQTAYGYRSGYTGNPAGSFYNAMLQTPLATSYSNELILASVISTDTPSSYSMSDASYTQDGFKSSSGAAVGYHGIQPSPGYPSFVITPSSLGSVVYQVFSIVALQSSANRPWRFLGPVSTKVAGVNLDTQIRSINFSTGMSATTDNYGNITVTASSTLVPGTTTVTGGTSGSLLYDNAGVLGELAVLPVSKGGTGTTTPSLVAGSNVTITGTWPNQTIASTGGGGGGGGGTQEIQYNGVDVVAAATGTNYTGAGVSVSVTLATPVVRGTSSNASGSVSSLAVTLPTGTVAGDFAIVSVGAGYAITVPGGWTTVYNTGSADGPYQAAVITKVLTSGDISTGSVTCTFAGNYDVTMTCVTFQGATGGLRTSAFYSSGGAHTLTTPSGPQAGDYAIFNASTRNGTIPAPSSGSLLVSVGGTPTSFNQINYSQAVASTGPVSCAFSASTSGWDLNYILVVAGTGTSTIPIVNIPGSGSYPPFSPPLASYFPSSVFGTGTATIANDTDIGLVITANGYTGDNSNVFYKAITAPGDWSATAQVQINARYDSGLSAVAAIYVGNSSGKWAYFGLVQSGTTSFAYLLTTNFSGTGAAGIDNIQLAAPARNYRVTYTSSTSTLNFYYSVDGKYFILLSSHTVSSLSLGGTPNSLGFGCVINNSASVAHASCAYWLDNA